MLGQRLAGQGQGTPCNKAEDREAKLLSICKSWRIDSAWEIRRKKENRSKKQEAWSWSKLFFWKNTHILTQEKKQRLHGENESNAEFVLWNFCLTENGSPSWRPSLLLTKFTCSSLRIGRTGVSRSGPRNQSQLPNNKNLRFFDVHVTYLFFEGYPKHPSVHFLNFWNTLGSYGGVATFNETTEVALLPFHCANDLKVWAKLHSQS